MNKRRRTDAEWQQLIEQQQRSGLRAHGFCQQHGLASKISYKRRQAFRQGSTATDSTGRFIKVHPTSAPSAGAVTTAVLHYHDSHLHVSAGVGAHGLIFPFSGNVRVSSGAGKSW